MRKEESWKQIIFEETWELPKHCIVFQFVFYQKYFFYFLTASLKYY